MKKHAMHCLRALTLVLATLLSLSAQATYVLDNCVRSDGVLANPVTIPVIQNIGRDVQEKEAYGRWFSHSITWTCTRKSVPAPPAPNAWTRPNDFFEVQTSFHPAAVTDRGLLPEDNSFRIYGFGQHNIGFIVKVSQHIEGQAEQTLRLNAMPGALTTTQFQGTQARQHGDVEKFHLTWYVRLVKLAGVPYTHAVGIHGITANFKTGKYHQTGPREWFHHSHYYGYFKTHVQNIKAACKMTVPSAAVPLGTVSAFNIRNPLQTGPSTGFKVYFKDCPQYIGAVSYQFQPLPGQPFPPGTPNHYGLLPQRNTSASAALGVAVQVLNEGDQPIAFNTPIPLAAYNPEAHVPVYSVPLKAHLIHIGNTLKAGDVEAAMNVVATYK